MMIYDTYTTAYRKARKNGDLDRIANYVGCPTDTLSRYRSSRRIAGQRRATAIRQAFINYGYIDKAVPLSELFPRWSTKYVPTEKAPCCIYNQQDSDLNRVPGTLADLWLTWLEEGVLTVQTIRDNVMRDCGIAGRKGSLSQRMQTQCEVFLHHAPRVQQSVKAVANNWIRESVV